VPVEPAVVEMFSAEVAEPVPGDSGVGEKAHLTPLGKPEQEKLTDELKFPPTAFRVTV
jgi:hypothetical protein